MSDARDAPGEEADWGYVNWETETWHARMPCAGLFTSTDELPLDEAVERGAEPCSLCAEDRREKRGMETRDQYSGANYE